MKRQDGFTLSNLVIVLIIVSFCVYSAFRVVPAYMDYWVIKKSLDAIVNDPQNGKASDNEIMLHLAKELEVNNVHVIKSTDVELERIPEGFKLSVDFSAKVPYFGAVSLVTDFHAEAATH